MASQKDSTTDTGYWPPNRTPEPKIINSSAPLPLNYPASFNTLVLFSVTTTSAHFVTTVSPHHKGKRLTFNGWWQSSWLPQAANHSRDFFGAAKLQAAGHSYRRVFGNPGLVEADFTVFMITFRAFITE